MPTPTITTSSDPHEISSASTFSSSTAILTVSVTKRTRTVSPFLFPVATTVLIFLSAVMHGCHVSPSHIPYITTKSSWLNVVLGKYTWFWTTCVYLLSLFPTLRPPYATRSLVRYLLATGYWFVWTQWCLGPSLLDRIDHWTGSCSVPLAHSKHLCLHRQGTWHAHDVSGHCLVFHHAYLVLMHEAPASYWVRGMCAAWAGLAVITVFYYHHTWELINGVFVGSLFSAVMYHRWV